MRYLLVIGFACDVYKREPRARILLNDQLIDEFEILTYSAMRVNSKEMYTLEPLKYFTIFDKILKNMFPPLKFYEIEINDKVDKLILEIHIDNDDNNYNNGFFTKSTLIKIPVIFFFPLCRNLITRLQKIFDKQKAHIRYPWRYSSKSAIFDLSMYGSWRGKIQKFYKIRDFTFGGSGNFIFEFRKKYGIFMNKINRSYKLHFDKHFINYFFDKYFQYANKRNSN